MIKYIPDLVIAIAEKTGYRRSDIKIIIDEMCDGIIEILCSYEDVSITNLGTFKVRQKKERMGEQPKTKEKILIPARKTIIFKVARSLKERVK